MMRLTQMQFSLLISCRAIRAVLGPMFGPLAFAICGMVLTQFVNAQGTDPGAAAPQSQPTGTADVNRDIPAADQQQAPVLARRSDYRIGPQDLVDISVFEAPELNRSVRVSASGEISLPLLGSIKAAGRTAKELELVLQTSLQKSFMNDPHVSVYVREMESHPVSVLGAVKKPGVFRIADPKTLLEVLSMAEGLADDAGDTVIVMRGAAFAAQASHAANQDDTSSQSDNGNLVGSIQVNLKDLLTSKNSSANVLVYPGDIVKVTAAGIVYVIGDVKKPGGFVLRNNENISALQALALAEGITPTSAKNHVRIIRTEQNSQRTEMTLDLGRIMSGKAPDPMLQSKDIIFVPKSGSKSALYRSAEAIISTVPAAAVYGRW